MPLHIPTCYPSADNTLLNPIRRLQPKRKEILGSEINATLSRILKQGLLMLGWYSGSPLAHAANRDTADGGQVLQPSKC